MTASTEVEKVSNSASTRRNRPGTKSSEYCQWPDESFEEMDSTLAVQQFIQQTIRKNVVDVEAILTAPETQDEGVWKGRPQSLLCWPPAEEHGPERSNADL